MKPILKRSLSTVLALCLCLSVVGIFPAFAYDESEATVDRIGGSGVGYKEEIVSEECIQEGMFLAYHPDWEPQKNVAGWFYGTSTGTLSVSIAFPGIGKTSISVSYAQASNVSGYYLSNPYQSDKIWARPGIYGDIYEITYNAGMYNFNTKRWVSVSQKTRVEARDTYLDVEHSTVKSDIE